MHHIPKDLLLLVVLERKLYLVTCKLCVCLCVGVREEYDTFNVTYFVNFLGTFFFTIEVNNFF